MTDKAALFEATTLKLLENSLITKLLPIKSLSIPKTECQSSDPSVANKFTIKNITYKRLKTIWYDYSGIETDNSNIIWDHFGCSKTLETGSNHCFAISYADDPNGETIYIRIPDNKEIYCFGDLFVVKQNLYSSSWLNSEELSVAHISAYEKLVDYKPEELNHIDFNLIRSSYYDDSDEFRALLQFFFDSFNETNKFIDPFFNPSYKLEIENIGCIRAGEYKVASAAKPYKPSAFLGSKFKFTLTNDLSAEVHLYWIDYAHNKQKLATLQPGYFQPFNSSLGNVFLLNEQQVCYIIEIGVAPFIENECNVKVSSLKNIINFDIENPQESINDSVIIKKTHFDKYNARQGSIGNCWFLQCLTSIYARYPKEIASMFIFPKLMNKTGIVALKLWSIVNKCWRLIILDDYLPFDTKWYGASPSGPLGNQFWVPLLEKAFAKLLDCYDNLDGMSVRNISVKEVYQMILGPLMDDMHYIGFELGDSTAFDKFLDFFKNGAVISFTARNGDPNGGIDDKTGIVSCHGYGLLDVKENVANTGFTLVKAHNVWSYDGEWKGDWADSSPLWEQYLQVKAELAFENRNDGTFWIEKNDFNRAFGFLWVASCSIK